MGIDISSLSLEELINLNKLVSKTLSNRDHTYKASVNTDRCYKNIQERLVNENIGPRCIESTEKHLRHSIFKICDITLGNYRTKIRDGEKEIATNGSLIMCNVDRYRSMCKEIIDIIEKFGGNEDEKENHELGKEA